MVSLLAVPRSVSLPAVPVMAAITASCEGLV
jgi:hypothetical protein